MSLQFKKVKAQITIQDIGRWGYQSSGVPISGPMDSWSFQNANLLVGNNTNAACIEIGMGSIEMVVTDICLIALCGNGHQLIINNSKVDNDRPTFCNEGCVLKVQPTSSGVWSYLSIGGGFKVPEVLGSRSTYVTSGFGGFEGRALKSGDELANNTKFNSITVSLIKALSNTENPFAQTKWLIGKSDQQSNLIRVIRGPEWDWISPSEQDKFITKSFTVSSDSNRMGYRLKGMLIERQVKDEMISSGVTVGTVQLTNDGSLIVLMADSQTVGGYPRIAQVAAVDISSFAQTKPGTEVKFELISNAEAESLLLEQKKDFIKLKAGIRFKVK